MLPILDRTFRLVTSRSNRGIVLPFGRLPAVAAHGLADPADEVTLNNVTGYGLASLFSQLHLGRAASIGRETILIAVRQQRSCSAGLSGVDVPPLSGAVVLTSRAGRVPRPSGLRAAGPPSMWRRQT